MTIPHLNDDIENKVTIAWDNRPGRFLTQVTADIPDAEQQRIVRGFFTLGTWDDALFMAEGVHERASRSMDLRAFAYPRAASKTKGATDPALQFEGVNIADGAFDYVNLSEGVFTRLMAQLLDVLVAGATHNKLPVTSEDWWKHFVELAADIRQRAQHGS